MFNEILTGKASLEPPPPGTSPGDGQAPYRAGPDAATYADCRGCGRSYPSTQGANGMCPTCTRVANQAVHQAMFSQQQYDLRAMQARDARNTFIWKMIIFTLLAIGFAIFKLGMRDAQERDASEAAGYKSYDSYGNP